MIRTVITAIALSIVSSTAIAAGYGSSSNIDACGPDTRLYAEVSEKDGNSFSTNAKVGFEFKWTFGQHKACEINNAWVTDTRIRATRTDEAKTTLEEIKAVKAKLDLCRSFDASAPASIITFCGDLLDAKGKE